MKTPTPTWEEMIDKILADYQIGFVVGDKDVAEHVHRFKSALTQLFKDLVAEANPLNPKGDANAVWAQKPYADGVKSFEQNLLKLLEGK